MLGGAFTFTPAMMYINISGLNFGQKYSVQIFEAFWNANWATNFTGGSNTSENVNLTGQDVGAGVSSVPQYLTGTFTASLGGVETISLGSPTEFEIFDAIRVRTAAVPEPSTWAMMLMGLGSIGMFARRRNIARAP